MPPMTDKDMMRALQADGEYLEAMTGKDHGPYFLDDDEIFDTYRQNNRAISWVAPLIVGTALGLAMAAAAFTFAYGADISPIVEEPRQECANIETVKRVGQESCRVGNRTLPLYHPDCGCVPHKDGGTFTPVDPQDPQDEHDDEEGDI